MCGKVAGSDAYKQSEISMILCLFSHDNEYSEFVYLVCWGKNMAVSEDHSLVIKNDGWTMYKEE